VSASSPPTDPSIDIPHWGFPFARGYVVEQDTPEHVMACENVIVACPVGFRMDRPEFGWPFPEFRTTPLSTDELTAALNQFEPRGAAIGAEYADEADAAIRHMQINVQVVADGN